MSKKRLAILLAIPTLIIVLLVGLTRDRDTNQDVSPSTSLPATVGEAAAASAVLRPAADVLEVPEESGCEALTGNADPVCHSFQVGDLEVAWLIEREAEGPPVASFLHRSSPASWTRVLSADGGVALFDDVNARVEDLNGDGRVETVFAFHLGNRLQLDVVEASGTVLFHFDAATGQAMVERGVLTLWVPEGADWRRQELRLVGAELEVISTDLVDGPAQGNI